MAHPRGFRPNPALEDRPLHKEPEGGEAPLPPPPLPSPLPPSGGRQPLTLESHEILDSHFSILGLNVLICNGE